MHIHSAIKTLPLTLILILNVGLPALALPDCLNKLLTTTSLDDDVPAAKEMSENRKAYLDASNRVYALDVKDMDYVLQHGSPSGRVYAAVLLRSSTKVGNNLSFDKLLGDSAVLLYRSGDKITKTTVAEVAHDLATKGAYQNFSYSLFCVMRTPVSAPEILLNAVSLERCYKGDSNQPTEVWKAFNALMNKGVGGRAEIDGLLASDQPAAKIYGAILLRRIDADAGTAKLKLLLNDRQKIMYSNSCSKEMTTVSALAGRLLKGEELVSLKNLAN